MGPVWLVIRRGGAPVSLWMWRILLDQQTGDRLRNAALNAKFSLSLSLCLFLFLSLSPPLRLFLPQNFRWFNFIDFEVVGQRLPYPLTWRQKHMIFKAFFPTKNIIAHCFSCVRCPAGVRSHGRSRRILQTVQIVYNVTESCPPNCPEIYASS